MLVLSLGVLAALIVLAPGTAGAGTAIKRGTYSGKTDQDAVATGFRRLQFTVSKGKVTLTTEPIVARGLCLSTDVFTQDGTPRARSSGETGHSPSRTPSSATRSTRSTAGS